MSMSILLRTSPAQTTTSPSVATNRPEQPDPASAQSLPSATPSPIIVTTQQESPIPSTSSPTAVVNTEATSVPNTTTPPPAPTRVSTHQRKPVNKLNLCTTVTPFLDKIPTSVAEALKDPQWRKAMAEEINAQLENRTWDLVSYVVAHNIVMCRWIFTIKRNVDGSVQRYKARLVAKGFSQRPGLDYRDTFSPVVKPATIQLVLSVAVSSNWQMRQFDVNHAFLQGHLTDEVYMMQPPGFVDKDNPTAVCKLRKAVYGLKQAPRAWYNELKTYLLSCGFRNSYADASLFIYNSNGVLMYMLVYVDDIILTGNNTDHINRFVQSFSQHFSLKDLGSLSYFLGIEATHKSTGLLLTQKRYITDLLHRNNMTNAKAVATPMCSTEQLTLKSGHPLDDPKQFRAVVGSLQYLSLTRPDISFAVNRMSQYMHQPTDEHWTAVKRIL